MNRALQFAIFFAVFLSVYLGLNYYVLARFYSLYRLKKDAVFVGVLLGMVLSYFIAALIGKLLPGLIAKIAYFVASLWMGVSFLLFSGLIVFEVLNLIFKLNKEFAGTTILVIVMIATIGGVFNALDFKVKTVELAGFGKDLTAVQLSDIHVGTLRNSGMLREIVTKTNALSPDVVFITGDLVDGSAPLHEGMFDELKNIKAPVYFVLGNHEKYEGEDRVLAILSKLNITILKNEKADFKGIQIIGLDYEENTTYADAAIEKIKFNTSKPTIVLNHAPTGLFAFAKKGIFLALSGHTHDGQIYPFNLFVYLRYRHISGLYEENGSYLYVSDGTGTWGPMMRVGTSAEITHIKLRK